MALTLHLNQFDGPLDLLLFLIGKAKIDIKDVFVSQVTDQYIESVREAESLDMEDASAFIAMAATLIEIKSRALLPRPEPDDSEEEDPEAALIRQLEEYQRFKQASEDMRLLEEAANRMFRKLPEEFPLPPPTLELRGLTLDGLVDAFAQVLARLRQKGEEEPEALTRRIVRDEYDVPGCMRHIQRKLRRGPVRFLELFSPHPTRDEVVTLFLALLELIRLGKADVTQSGIYEEIILTRADRQPMQEGTPRQEADPEEEA